MAEQARSLAIDCKYLGTGVPGDGVAATTFEQCREVHESSLTFNFTEANQIQFKAMGQEDPWAVVNRKGDPSSIEWAIPSPTAKEMQTYMGGKVTDEKWEAPITAQTIEKSVKFQTADYQGKYTEYLIPKASISARLSQAPTEEETDLLLVRATILTPVSAAGVRASSFSREVKAVAPEG